MGLGRPELGRQQNNFGCDDLKSLWRAHLDYYFFCFAKLNVESKDWGWCWCDCHKKKRARSCWGEAACGDWAQLPRTPVTLLPQHRVASPRGLSGHCNSIIPLLSSPAAVLAGVPKPSFLLPSSSLWRVGSLLCDAPACACCQPSFCLLPHVICSPFLLCLSISYRPLQFSLDSFIPRSLSGT